MRSVAVLYTAFVAVLFLMLSLAGGDSKIQTEEPDQFTYVALGDSIATGTGSSDSPDGVCAQNRTSYPEIVGSSLGAKTINISCSGAAVDSGLTNAQIREDRVFAPQLNVLANQVKPDVMTLTIGANDVRWTRFVQCYSGQCGQADERQSFSRLIEAYKINLSTFFSRLNEMYDGVPPTVFLTDYLQVLPSTSTENCRELDGISPTELRWGRQVITDLNQAIKTVGQKYSFVRYVEVDFTDHELCTEESWVQNADDPSPYHLNADGQREYADKILNAIKHEQERSER